MRTDLRVHQRALEKSKVRCLALAGQRVPLTDHFGQQTARRNRAACDEHREGRSQHRLPQSLLTTNNYGQHPIDISRYLDDV